MCAGITEEQLFSHQLFVTDYTYLVADPRPYPGGRLIRIIDMAGMKLADAHGEHFSYACKVAMSGIWVAAFGMQRHGHGVSV